MFEYKCSNKKCNEISSFVYAQKDRDGNVLTEVECKKCGKNSIRIYGESLSFNVPPGDCGNYKNGYSSPRSVKR